MLKFSEIKNKCPKAHQKLCEWVRETYTENTAESILNSNKITDDDLYDFFYENNILVLSMPDFGNIKKHTFIIEYINDAKSELNIPHLIFDTYLESLKCAYTKAFEILEKELSNEII